MAIHNNLALIVFISLAADNLIQSEIIRGVDIPRLNVTRIAGKWYMVTTYEENKQLKCSTSIVTPQSDNIYTLNATYSFASEARNNSPSILNEPINVTFNATIENDSNVIRSKSGNGNEVFWVMFDVDYDSYMAIYGTITKEAITNGTQGWVFIVSRQPTIPGEVIEKVKQSDFYQQGVDPSYHLISLNASGC